MKRRRRSRQLDSAVRTRSSPRRRGLRPTVPLHPDVRRRLARFRLRVADLHWRCDTSAFDFRTTRDIENTRLFIGQRKALKILRMGLKMESPGYNVFICGLSGTRKVASVERYVRSIRRQHRLVADRLYVHNFENPQRPRLLELPAGDGQRCQGQIGQLLARIHESLEKLPPAKWRAVARRLIDEQLPPIRERFPDVEHWLDQWRRCFLQNIRTLALEDFEVNSLGQAARSRGPRVVVETNPTHANLFGWIGRRGIGDQSPTPHFTEIRRGSFLDADGGVLVLDANDVYNSPGVWSTLRNCLKYGTLEIQDGDPSAPARSGVLNPQPIATRTKVVVVGDYHLYDFLFETDPDFQEIFKIRVDFEPEVNLSPKVLGTDYPAFVAEICQQEGLRHVAASGVARIVEYAVRKAGRRNKITAQSSLIADLLREADYWAGAASRRAIVSADVQRAIDEAIARVNLLEKKIAEMILEGTILISTSGSRVGQVNGLAIYDMGDYFFGKPSRITCETSVGQAGIINIERESGFSGRSHDKGVQILAGYLRSCFAQNRPLSLTASVCFEQSYSGIDGDSASATEIYAILSSLAGLPIRQDIAVTGSLSQKGDIQPIGGVNEKIEGFFDCVRAGRWTGLEGVVIPRKNVSDLMLRKDVVNAVKRSEFHIYAIDKVTEGIEVLTGIPAGRRRRNATYPPDSVFARVDQRLEELASDLRRYGEASEES
ncbi:MAG: AAA family ATPase [Planctomycetota bacterium]|nr:AAA family ATPase [Planctomycetota bacterium]